MSAYKVSLHCVFEICKTRFYLPRCIRKRDYHTAQYVRHNHSIYNAIFNINRVTHTQSMWKDQRLPVYTILNRIMIHMRLLDTAKLGTNATRF